MAAHCNYNRIPMLILSRLVFGVNLICVVSFDVAEVIGTAVVIRLLFGIPLWVGVLLSVCDTLLVVLLQKNGRTCIEIVVDGLLFILAACLIYEFILPGPSLSQNPAGCPGAVVKLFENPLEGVVIAMSIMGSVIMSHNFFLHSWLEKERRNPHLSSPQMFNSDIDNNNSSATSVQSQRHPDEQQVQSSTNNQLRCTYSLSGWQTIVPSRSFAALAALSDESSGMTSSLVTRLE